MRADDAGRGGAAARWIPAAVALLAAALAFVSSRGATPTDDEPTYAGQGAYLLRSGDFYAPALKWQPPLALYVTSAGLPFVETPEGSFDARPAADSLTDLGDRLLADSPSPGAVLAASRAPVVFVFAALAALAAWLAARLATPRAGLVAGFLVAASPMFFAHGGLATTDAVAAAAALVAVTPLVAAAHAGTAWTLRRAALCGAALGVGLLAKHTAVALVPLVVAAVAALARRTGSTTRRSALLAAAALAAAGLTLWAGYGFHVGPLVPPDSKGDLVRKLGLAWAEGAARALPVPAPAWVQSLAFQAAKQHDRLYFHFLGEKRMTGWWTYFPVVTAAKATLGSVALLAAAAWTVRRARLSAAEWILAAAFALPFGAAVVSRHNLGVRHVLPALAPLCVLAGARVGRGDASPRARTAVVALLAVHAAEGLSGVRDGVAWWNAAAGGTAGGWRIAVQSNADWGQGFGRLRDEVRAHGLDDIWVLPAAGPAVSRARLETMGFRVYSDPGRRAPLPERGWLAISTSAWRAQGHDPVTDAPPDLFLAGCFRVYRLPLRGERTP